MNLHKIFSLKFFQACCQCDFFVHIRVISSNLCLKVFWVILQSISKFVSVRFYWCFLLSVWNCSDSKEVSLQKPSVHKEGIFLIDRYVGANTCAECHDQVHEKWEGSPPLSCNGIAQ
jgi:hypothetical protein